VKVYFSPLSKTNIHDVKKHMVVLYDCITNGSISRLVTNLDFIGTPKLPKASIPPKAAIHPHSSHPELLFGLLVVSLLPPLKAPSSNVNNDIGPKNSAIFTIVMNMREYGLCRSKFC
jgi:hypothetical protein